MTKQQQIAQFLDRHATDLPRSPYWYPVNRPPWEYRPSVEGVTKTLLQMTEFRALQLGTFFNTVDGQIIAQAVEMIAPPFYREDIELLVAALQLAAVAQQRQARRAALGAAVSAVGAGLTLFYIERQAARA